MEGACLDHLNLQNHRYWGEREKHYPSLRELQSPVKKRTTTAPPPRPTYDKPAPPRRVINPAYDYPEFLATPNPAPPLGQSYFGWIWARSQTKRSLAVVKGPSLLLPPPLRCPTTPLFQWKKPPLHPSRPEKKTSPPPQTQHSYCSSSR